MEFRTPDSFRLFDHTGRLTVQNLSLKVKFADV